MQRSHSRTRAIRTEYERQGVDGFYRAAAEHYQNPHEPQVRSLIRRAVSEWPLDLTHVFDLAAGSGEATLALLGPNHTAGVVELSD